VAFCEKSSHLTKGRSIKPSPTRDERNLDSRLRGNDGVLTWSAFLSQEKQPQDKPLVGLRRKGGNIEEHTAFIPSFPAKAQYH
jgi:hypothetical protein